jgi:hypothetical protein
MIIKFPQLIRRYCEIGSAKVSKARPHAFRRHELTFLAHRFSGSRRRGILGN